MKLHEYLNRWPLTSWNNESLTHKASVLGVSTEKSKTAIVKAIVAHLTPERIENIWRSLPEFEQDIFALIAHTNQIDYDDLEKLARKHYVGMPINPNSLVDFFDVESPSHALVYGAYVPDDIKSRLAKFIPPLDTSLKHIEAGNDLTFSLGEDFSRDLVSILNLANSNSITLTKRGYPNKPSMTKMLKMLSTPEPRMDPASIEETFRLYPLFKLVEPLLVTQENTVCIGSKTNEFVVSSAKKRCKYLLDKYLKADLIEFESNQSRRTRTYCPSRVSARQKVIDKIKNLPLNSWFSMESLLFHMKFTERNFFSGLHIEYYNKYDRQWYSTSNWELCEASFIRMCLVYLSCLGIIDLAWTSYEADSRFNFHYLPTCFRLSPFGGFILGVNSEYKESKMGPKESGFVVQPNMEIVVSEGQLKDAHTLFFNQFAERVGQGVTPVFRLDFKGIATALDIGYQVSEIADYLKEHAQHGVPGNVLTTLADWDNKSKKVRIRTVTILETTDPYLLKELSSYKTIDKYMQGEVNHAMVIDNKSAVKVKKECEKKSHFCLLE